MSNLNIELSTPEVGYYNDSWSGHINIRSQEDLDNLVAMIDLMIKLNK